MADKEFHFVVKATVRDGVIDKCYLQLDPESEDNFREGTVYDVDGDEWQSCSTDENMETDEAIATILVRLLDQHNDERADK